MPRHHATACLEPHDELAPAAGVARVGEREADLARLRGEERRGAKNEELRAVRFLLSERLLLGRG